MNDLSKWQSNTILGGALENTCAGIDIGGGSKTYLHRDVERTYEDLPAHTMIFFTIKLWFLDGWDANDNFEVILDSKTFSLDGLKASAAPSNLCGKTTKDLGIFKI